MGFSGGVKKMIKAIRSDKSSFKNIEFQKGFNVILAERTKEASNKDSRNGLGKTTLIEIIHFCLGGNLNSLNTLKSKELKDWTFIMDLTLRKKDYVVARKTSDPSKVILKGDFNDWPIKPNYDSKKNEFIMNVKDWVKVLGYLMFDIPFEINNEKKYKLSFRSLISYFVRHGKGAYLSPFKHFEQQKEFDIQIHQAFLLGLNWEYARELQLLKDEKKNIDSLRRMAEEGFLVEYFGEKGSLDKGLLEAELVNLTSELEELNNQLRTFRVHPQYYVIQGECDKITSEIHSLRDKRHLLISLKKRYEDSIEEEKDVSIDHIKNVYEECGILLKEYVVKKIEEVLEFHKKITANRKEYLYSEIERLDKEINKIEKEIEKKSEQRAELMKILETHGALEEFAKLQQRASVLSQRIEEIKSRIEYINEFENKISQWKIKKEELLNKMRQDFKERELKRREIITYFNKNIEYLYEEPGLLGIEVSDDGYRFKIEMKRAKSQGISNMQIFCYDLALMQLRSIYEDMPGFLIHDSIIFDGVDERQKARALELAYKESIERGFQYICTLNSDMIPINEFSSEMQQKFKSSIRAIFTDSTDDGGLLGVRF